MEDVLTETHGRSLSSRVVESLAGIQVSPCRGHRTDQTIDLNGSRSVRHPSYVRFLLALWLRLWLLG